ncbi:hypothetical protein LRAMOSA03231 [Lichtheimia ramosa]|uniref:Zn(2)-C6 fungal-type domain-containing protein n=1 Tax=Lichtheimia ramosa TaxID=688394 RepID=A0A077WW35_9FUNG|nr:hypothetical protein LRAMOSA03231 [Lichtheimia ramosa]
MPFKGVTTMASAGTSVSLVNTASMPNETRKPVQRKKKAARACIHCQKAHLTCDDSRPCQRCIKRDLASTCTDGARKKAKYLQDVQDPLINNNEFTTPLAHTPGALSEVSADSSMTTTTTTTTTSPFVNDAIGNGVATSGSAGGGFDFDNNSSNYGFGSSATNLEYSFLSNMLGTSFLDSATSDLPLWTTTTTQQQQQSPTISSQQQQHPILNPFGDTMLFDQQQSSPTLTSTSSSTTHHPPPALMQYGQGAVLAKQASPIASSRGIRRRNQLITPEMAYASVKKPFSYADGYHYLINYVRQNMTREDLMRISRALALFRPSVFSSMMNLTESDLIFTEKCLQRTLLEYEKLISYSGTPTVVWRRTGEIVLVGKEFSLLTQWSRESLLSKKTYIYEVNKPISLFYFY